MYEVISAFRDLTDYIKTKSGPVYHRYEVGDTYPRDGMAPTEERVVALLTGKNNLKRPLIRALETQEAPACEGMANGGTKARTRPKRRRKPSGKGETG